MMTYMYMSHARAIQSVGHTMPHSTDAAVRNAVRGCTLCTWSGLLPDCQWTLCLFSSMPFILARLRHSLCAVRWLAMPYGAVGCLTTDLFCIKVHT